MKLTNPIKAYGVMRCEAEESPFDEEAKDNQEVSRSPSADSTEDVSDDDALSFGGEEREVFKSFEEETSEIMLADIQITMPSKEVATLERNESFYGHPLSEEHAAEAMPLGGGGLVWHALVVPNEFFQEGKLKKGLPKRDFDVETQTVKPRRPSLPVTSRDFFSSLTRIEGPDGPRWIFHGVLNGWPALTCLELISLQARRTAGSFFSPKDFVAGQFKLVWMHHWSADREGKAGQDPEITDVHRIYHAKLRGAPWTSIGWSKDNPGFVFWYEPMHPNGSRLNYGTKMVQSMSDTDICTMVHMISHRYAVGRESAKDRLTYHSIVLLEWDHGKHCTVVEGALLNGIGGYKGRCNWYHDKNENVTKLFRALPDEMIAPWLTSAAEIRCYDVEAKNLDELKTFIESYEGSTKRFVDPHYTFSHRARLSYRSKKNIAQYLLNYTGRDCTYDELKRNCQTFAADLCSFLAGKKNIEPFHPIHRILFEPRPYLFLYESHMYEKTKQARRNENILL